MLSRILLPSLCCLFAASPALAQEDSRKTQPNVLFIAVDDLRPELGTYGTRALTPNIDRLASTGLRFDRAYCNQAVCGASRVSLMTGLYPEKTGERSYHVTDWRKRWKHIVTLNQHFGAAGYTTVGLGKIYHGSGGPGVDPNNWTKWIPVKGESYVSKPDQIKRRKRNGKNRGPSTDAADVSDSLHVDGQRAKVGAQQLRKLAGADKPFFLAVGFTKPHLPFVAPQKYWDLYSRDSFGLPSGIGVPPGYPKYASNYGAGELRAYSDIPLQAPPAKFPSALNKRLIHGYHACVSYTDRNIGVLLDALQASGEADNTIVVLWADHGWKLGDHSSWCKHTNFECDARVPLIIRNPATPGAVGATRALTELIDLYPTLCDLCGLSKPDHLQGKSFSKLLDSATTGQHRQAAYSSYPHSDRKRRLVGHSIRTAQYRFTQWWDAKTDEVVDSVLTDIESDPTETTAVTGNAKLEAELAEMLKQRVLSARN
ncbi:MAG: sulfatase [Aureliella sp.]